MGDSDSVEAGGPEYCPRCRAAIPQGESTCPQCNKPAHGEGMFRRIANWLLNRAPRTGTVKVDFDSGQGTVVRQRILTSSSEVPPEVAATIRAARQSGGVIAPSCDDRAGHRPIYNSWDEVPAEIRRRLPPFVADTFEQARATTSTAITIGDATTGEDRTFASWDEVPDELKERIPPEMRRWMAAKAAGVSQEAAPAEAASGGVVVERTTTSNVVDIRINDVRSGS